MLFLKQIHGVVDLECSLWKPWPRTLKSRVTMQGLLVPRYEAGGDGDRFDLYKWNDVSPAPLFGCYWWVLDESGQPLKKQGRRLQFSCRTCRASFVAQRLRSRWYRNTIRSGSLYLRERLEPSLKNRWPVILSGVTGFVVLTAVWMSQASMVPWHGPKDEVFWIAFGVFITMYVAGMTLLGVGPYMTFQLIRRLKIKDVTYTSTGIAIATVGGDCRTLTWGAINSIEKESVVAVITTRNGEIYRFRTTPRSREALEAAIRLFIPEDLGRRRKSVGKITSRIGAAFAIGAGIIYVLLSRFLPEGSFKQSPSEAAGLFLGFGALVVLGGAVYASVPDLDMRPPKCWFRLTRRFSRWWNRGSVQ